MLNKKAINGSPLKSPLRHSPFDRLKGLIDCSDLQSSKSVPQISQRDKGPAFNPLDEQQLFLNAMDGVNPIDQDHAACRNASARPAGPCDRSPEDESLSRLVSLVRHGEGFVVSDTPEYMEGTGYRVNREFARRLHRGDFSIQGHIDLHGLTSVPAKEAFESFLQAAISSGKRAVLVIHGRGLSSPGEPVLKNKVREWLNQGYWLKRIIAYASAQSHDGGAGATYVLLRSRPVLKSSGHRRS